MVAPACGGTNHKIRRVLLRKAAAVGGRAVTPLCRCCHASTRRRCEAAAHLEPHALRGDVSHAVLGQQLRGDDAQGAQQAPASMDELDLPAVLWARRWRQGSTLRATASTAVASPCTPLQLLLCYATVQQVATAAARTCSGRRWRDRPTGRRCPSRSHRGTRRSGRRECRPQRTGLWYGVFMQSRGG
jgi:hypothetical protein